jgi:hypothetical protein
MPNIPAGQQFKADICNLSYPCIEQGGVIWIYMGKSATPPEIPAFEFLNVPDNQKQFRLFYNECNYLQAMEGGIDPTHVMWLHSPYDLQDEAIAAQHQGAQQQLANKTRARTPAAIEIVDTPAGFMYGTKRKIDAANSLWRINQFFLPFYTMPPSGTARGARMWVPIDDENCVKWMIGWYPNLEIMRADKDGYPPSFAEESHDSPTMEPYGHIRQRARKSNGYLINREIHKAKRLGISGVNLQDQCIVENEGPTPILDRTRENLCPADFTTVKARRMLLHAATILRESGTTPPGVLDPTVYRFRGVSRVIPDNINWLEGLQDSINMC